MLTETERIELLEKEVKKLRKEMRVVIGVIDTMQSEKAKVSSSSSSSSLLSKKGEAKKLKALEKTRKWVSTLKPLALVDKKKFASILDTFNNINDSSKRKRSKDKEEKDDSKEPENKKAKKEKNVETTVASSSSSSSLAAAPTITTPALLEKLKSITLYDNKIDMIKQISDEQVKKLCNMKSGGGVDLLVEWLNEEATFMENNSENFRGIALVKLLVHIIDPTIDKSLIKWNHDKVKAARIDKIIRRIYKCLQGKIGSAITGINSETDILINMTDTLKKCWAKFREIIH
jgi:hypothetical protein